MTCYPVHSWNGCDTSVLKQLPCCFSRFVPPPPGWTSLHPHPCLCVIQFMSWFPSAPYGSARELFLWCPCTVPTPHLPWVLILLIAPQGSLSDFHQCFTIIWLFCVAFPDCTACFASSVPKGEIKLMPHLEMHKTWPHWHSFLGFFLPPVWLGSSLSS